MNIDEIRKETRRRLSTSRYLHSELVAKYAVSYASKLGYDKEKAEIAGLLHDIAREYTDEENKEAIQKYKIKLSKFAKDFKPSVHGYIGAAVAEHEFDIHDQDILAAIRNHVTGRPCMHLLEEIVFISDHRARANKENVSENYDNLSIEQVMYSILRCVIQYDVSHGKKIDFRTQMTFDWYLEKIEKQVAPEEVDISENVINEFDQEMDELIMLYHEHRACLEHVNNLRDLGGYVTQDGKVIKRNKILRSGNLDNFTREDYKKLLELGVNYVIDLRQTSEKKKPLGENVSGIHYINIPFNMQSEDESRINYMLEKYKECNDPEEAAWVAARYFLSFDMDNLYMQILSDKESCEKIKQILHIMLADDCTGVLIFCQSGKDRTGIVSCILMSLLGVDPQIILQDYRLSMVAYYAIALLFFEFIWEHRFNEFVLKKVVDVLHIDKNRPQRLNEKILEKYSSYNHYFDSKFCFLDDELVRFKDKFLQSKSE